MVKFSTDIHGYQTVYHNDFGDNLAFPLAPPWSGHLSFFLFIFLLYLSSTLVNNNTCKLMAFSSVSVNVSTLTHLTRTVNPVTMTHKLQHINILIVSMSVLILPFSS